MLSVLWRRYAQYITIIRLQSWCQDGAVECNPGHPIQTNGISSTHFWYRFLYILRTLWSHSSVPVLLQLANISGISDWVLCDVSPDIIIVCADNLHGTTVCILQIATDPKCWCFDTESDNTLQCTGASYPCCLLWTYTFNINHFSQFAFFSHILSS